MPAALRFAAARSNSSSNLFANRSSSSANLLGGRRSAATAATPLRNDNAKSYATAFKRRDSRFAILRALGISSIRTHTINELDAKLLFRFRWLCVNAFSGIALMVFIQQVCWDPVQSICQQDSSLETVLKCFLSIGSCLLVYQLLDCQRLQEQISALEQGRMSAGILVPVPSKNSVALLDQEIDAEQAFLQHVLHRVGSLRVILFGHSATALCCGRARQSSDTSASESHGWRWFKDVIQYLCCYCLCCCVDLRGDAAVLSHRLFDDHTTLRRLARRPLVVPSTSAAAAEVAEPAPEQGGGAVSSNADYTSIDEDNKIDYTGSVSHSGSGASSQAESWHAAVRSQRWLIWLQILVYFFHLPPAIGIDNKFGLIMLFRIFLVVRLLHLTSPLYRQRLNISRALQRSVPLQGDSQNYTLPRFGWQMSLKLLYTDEPWFLIGVLAVTTVLTSGYALHILERTAQPMYFAVSLSAFPPAALPIPCTVVPSPVINTTLSSVLHFPHKTNLAQSMHQLSKSLSGDDSLMANVTFWDRFFSGVGGFFVSIFVCAQCLLFLWPSDVYAIWQPSLMASKLMCMSVSAVGLFITTLMIGVASSQLMVRHVEEGAMQYIRIADADDELRHAAACILQLMFRSRRRQRALMARIKSTRAALLLRTRQEEHSAANLVIGSLGASLADRVLDLNEQDNVADWPSSAAKVRTTSESDENNRYYLQSDLRLMSHDALNSALTAAADALVDEQCICVQEMILCRHRFQRARRRLIDLQCSVFPTFVEDSHHHDHAGALPVNSELDDLRAQVSSLNERIRHQDVMLANILEAVRGQSALKSD